LTLAFRQRHLLRYKDGVFFLIVLFLLIPIETESHNQINSKDIELFYITEKQKPAISIAQSVPKKDEIKIPIRVKQREYFDFVKIHLKSKGAEKEFERDLLTEQKIHHYATSNFFNGHVNQCLDVAKKMGYFSYIVPTLESYNIPNTFSLIPVIESCFDPQAVSIAKAVGMWQINRITARHLDMKIQKMAGGWEEDERYNWKRSTHAAAEYILFLKERFPTWELVLAAYNLGPTKLREQINKHRTINIDYLHLPRETRNYVYKFIAMTDIIKKEKL